MNEFKSCDICKQSGMNPHYYKNHMHRCHRPCDRCKEQPMVAEVIATDPAKEVWIRPPIGLCAACLDRLELPKSR